MIWNKEQCITVSFTSRGVFDSRYLLRGKLVHEIAVVGMGGPLLLAAAQTASKEGGRMDSVFFWAILPLM